jgi:hypothetical protein
MMRFFVVIALVLALALAAVQAVPLPEGGLGAARAYETPTRLSHVLAGKTVMGTQMPGSRAVLLEEQLHSLVIEVEEDEEEAQLDSLARALLGNKHSPVELNAKVRV